MIGHLKDLAFTRNGEQILSVTLKTDISEMFDELKDYDVDIVIKRHRERRSLDANAYCWVLCGKIAEKLADDDVKNNKDAVYREAIREIGVYKEFPNMSLEDAKTLRTAWSMLGTGWITEQVDYTQNGNVIVRCYYGSSTYNTKQMSRLIDNLIQDCEALGIPTETPEQIEKMKSLWANDPKKGQSL